jgi:hypothetical protein
VGFASSVLDEHPVATPQVGSPAFRMMNCSASQMPMIRTIVPMVSTISLLSGGVVDNAPTQAISGQRSAFS